MDRQKLIIGITFAAAMGLCTAGWFALPLLQGAERTVMAETSRHIERARRLLQQYNAELSRASMLTDQLGEIDAAVGDPQELAEELADEFQAHHKQLWDLYEPRDWTDDRAVPARASYGNISGQIRDGVQARAQAISRNQQLLADALAAVDEALRATSGNATGQANAEANRLKAIILYHQGLTELLRAWMKQDEAEDVRDELLRIAREASAYLTSQNLIADTDIDARIAGLTETIANSEAELVALRKEADALNAIVGDLESRHAAALQRARTSRSAMDRLEDEGVDFSDPNGGELFRARLLEQMQIFQQASRESHLLEVGGYPQAEIDDSGDFLRGRYLENGSPRDITVSLGLNRYRHDQAILNEKLARSQASLDVLRRDLVGLQELRAAHETGQAKARQHLEEAAELAEESYAELNRMESEASSMEEKGLNLLDQSAKLSQQAQRLAEQWIADARGELTNLSPEARQRSAFEQRSQDEWMVGHIAAQAADARMARARALYARHVAATQTAAALKAVQATLPLSEADAESELVKAAQSREAGVEEIKQAMQILEKSHRTLGNHWTLIAQQAATLELLAAYGLQGYRADAIEAYRNAVKGRETESYVDPIRTRLRQLETP